MATILAYRATRGGKKLPLSASLPSAKKCCSPRQANRLFLLRSTAGKTSKSHISVASLSTLSMDHRYIHGFHKNVHFNDFIIALEEDKVPRILAVSPDTLKPSEQRLLSRFVRWCKEWIESIWEAILVSFRVSEITVKLSPLFILTPAAYLTAQFTDAEKSNIVSDWAWMYAMYAIQRLGPGYVKL